MFDELTVQGEELLKEILLVNKYSYEEQYEFLKNKFSNINHSDDSRLRSIFKELGELELIETRWADSMPYTINITNYGYTYFDRKKKYIKEQKKLKRREWRIAIISALIGGGIGLIPYIITLIK